MLFLLFIVFQASTDNVNAQKYRKDYMFIQEFQAFYSLHDIAMNWERARQICEGEGSELLVPSSITEMENLKVYITNMRAYYTSVFIGLHDKFSTGHFVDLKGEPIADTYFDLLWAPGKPDNANGSEHCVVMSREGLMDDQPCSDIYPFICKRLRNENQYNEPCDTHDAEFELKETGTCYKFHEEPLTWHDAYMICDAHEGSLAVINSEEEAVVVTSYLNDHLQNKVPNPDVLFIGFSDLMYQYEYRTVLGQTLEEANYSIWDPYNEDIADMKAKRCGAISRSGKLTMTWCDVPAMFLCEKTARVQVNSTKPEDKPPDNDNRPEKKQD